MVTEQASNGTRVKSAVTRLPGLDGVRALAVIAVIAFHEQLSVLPGGFLGVDVFFVLSGYLITDLLAAQWHQHGRLRLRHVLVFALGTNGSFTAGQLHQLLAIIGPSRELVLVNTYEARSWEAADNRLIDTAAHRYPNVFLANWFATIEHRTSLLWPDEVHPQPSGARLYAHTVAAAVRNALSASVAVTPTGPPLAHHLRPAS